MPCRRRQLVAVLSSGEVDTIMYHLSKEVELEEIGNLHVGGMNFVVSSLYVGIIVIRTRKAAGIH